MECKIILKAKSELAQRLKINEDVTFDSKQALLDYINSHVKNETNQRLTENIAGVTKMLTHQVSNINAGIQQDASHSTENSNVILPSQMFNAFTFKGYAQREVNEIYNAIADIATRGLSDTFFKDTRSISEIKAELEEQGVPANELDERAKTLQSGELVDFSQLVRQILNKDADAKNKMLKAYREILLAKGQSGDTFGLLEVLTETFDALNIPIDNPHMFNTAVSELANKFTKEAIKIKFDGQFAVLKPGSGSQQVYEITSGRMPYKNGMSIKYRPVNGLEIVTRERAKEWAIANNVDIATMKPRNLQGQYVTMIDNNGVRTQLSMASGDQLIPEAKALAQAKILINKYKDLAEAGANFEKLYKDFIKEYKKLPTESQIDSFVDRYINSLPDGPLKKDVMKGNKLEKIFISFNPESAYFKGGGKSEETGDRAKLRFLSKINTLGKVLTSELNRFFVEASEGKIPISLHGPTINNDTGHKIEISRAEVIVDLTARDKFFIREGDDIGDINEDFFYNRLVEKSGLNTVYHGADRMIKSGQQKILFHYGVPSEKYDNNKSSQAEYDPLTNVVNVYGTPEGETTNKLLFSLKGQTSVRMIDGNMHIFLNETKPTKDVQKAIKGDLDSNYNRVFNYLNSQYKTKEEDLSKVTEETRQEQREELLLKAKQIYNSWNKYLDIIGTRIPGQHYQSFQGMRIVGFATGNKIFVPNEVTMLAGSDFDIDKANLIYYSVERSGLLSSWHPSFNYDTKENLEVSMKLPLPTNRKASEFLSEEIAGYSIDDTVALEPNFNTKDLISLVSLYEELKNGKKLPNTETGIKVAAELEVLDDTSKFKVTPKGINNFTISRANTVINNPKNYPLLQKPVSMASPQLMGSMSKEGKDAKQRSKEQMSSVVQGTIDNMIGKEMIGIVASTGLKSLSALTAVYNKSIMDLSDLSKKLDRLSAIQTENKDEQAQIQEAKSRIESEINLIKQGFPDEFSVANINFENASPEVLKVIRARFTSGTGEADIQARYIIQNMMEGLSDDSAEIHSELLSASTDNAKELILGKIRAIPEFGTIYTALITQGVPFWNIVEIMTSPTTDFYMRNFNKEAFNKKWVNFDSALGAINQINDYFEDNGGKIDDTFTAMLKSLQKNFGFTYKNKSIEDATGQTVSVSDLSGFKDLLTQGKAVQILGKYLGINQGIKAKAFEIYSFTKTIEKYIKDTHGIEFSFTEFLNSLNDDKVYANKMIKDTSKGAFNLLYVLSRATNFEKQLQGFNVTNQMLRISTYKLNGAYLVTNALEGYVMSAGKPLNEDQFNEVQRFIDNNVLLHFFKQETKINNDVATRPVFYDGLNRLELTTVKGRNDFMTWVHDKFIPRVKNMIDFQNNEFIRDLTYETVKDTLYAEPVPIIRMTYDTTNAISEETKSKEDGYKYSLNKLRYGYDIDPSEPTANNVFNVLFWYNTLVNKGGTGKYSWAKMQNELVINSKDHPFNRLAELQGQLGKATSFSTNSNASNIEINGIKLDLQDLIINHNLVGEVKRINETFEEEKARLAERSGEAVEENYDEDNEDLYESFSNDDFDPDNYEEQSESNSTPLTKVSRQTRKGEVGTRVKLQVGKSQVVEYDITNPMISIPYDYDQYGKVTAVETEKIPAADSARAIRELGSRFEELNPNIEIQFRSKLDLISLSNDRKYDYTNAKAFIIDGQVNINLDKASLSDVVHEYGHLFLHSLKYESLEMYNNLISLATNHDRFDQIAGTYNNLNAADLNEEVFVTLFGEAMRTNLVGDDPNKELMLNFANFTKEKLSGLLNSDVQSITDLSSKQVANLTLEEAINLMGDAVMKNRIQNIFDNPKGFTREIKKLKDDLFQRELLEQQCSG